MNILACTHAEFGDFIRQRLGKGFNHALLIYEEWFRSGVITDNNPAFNNAKELFHQILALTDQTVLPLVDERQDGQTDKFLLQTDNKLEIESVVIPMQAGTTLCISSQVGCRMGCAFCETGKMGLLKNLTPAEIISQIFVARFRLKHSIRNIVFMGMGEPFDNYDAVMQSVRVLTDPHGLAIGHQHITISTSGCVDGIIRLMEEKGPIPHLAVSINAPTNEIRNKLMPINRKYPLEELHAAMKSFNEKTGKEILIAYVLMKDKNDSLDHADALAHYLKGLAIKINIIPYNPQSRDRFQTPDSEVIDAFTHRLREHGYYTLLRKTKGDKIMAACGQLGNKKLPKTSQKIKTTEITEGTESTVGH